MRILVDTNVIIHLEDDHVLDASYARFSRLASRSDTLVVHPLSRKEIERNGDPIRKDKTLSKIAKYPKLERPPIPDDEFIRVAGFSQGVHDSTDANMLFAVMKRSVDFLVTEDLGIHRRAKRMKVNENVLTVDQAVSLLERLTSRSIPKHTLLEHIPVHNLDLGDPFFNSLRSDYGGELFNDWFHRISSDGRMCWAYRENGRVLALCVYKEETKSGADSENVLTPTLKLCTFKDSRETTGKKLGESMLKLAFNYADKNNLASVYLTVLPKYEDVVLLLEDNGFHQVDTKGQEVVMSKVMIPPSELPQDYDVLGQYSIDYYPHYYENLPIQKFLVPIRPEFHDRLFPDCSGTQRRIIDFTQPCPEGNTIKKAYICNAPTKQIRKGDILLFYRSVDRKEITSVGVVERFMRSKNPTKIAAVVGNRTVYTFDEIEHLARGEALALIFRHMENLKHPVSASKLLEFNIKGPIQSIRRIREEIYVGIIEEGRG